MLAVAADGDRNGRTKRIRFFNGALSLPVVVGHADRCVDRALLHRFGARREHADREFEVAVDHIARRPVARISVIEIPSAGRESEHRKDAPVREPFAEAILNEDRILARERDLLNEFDPDEVQCVRTRRRIRRQHGAGQKQIARVFDFRRMAVDPFLNDLGDRPAEVSGRHCGGSLGPSVRAPELSVHAVAVGSGE
jgi:hypothetical protein